MLNENKQTLAKLRLQQASECLRDAETMLASDSYKAAANRSYYCIFHAMRAVLAIDAFDSKRHTGIISKFRETYIKTGIFPTNFSDIIRQAFHNRGKSDYDDFFVIMKDDTAVQIENAKIFLTAATKYLEPMLNESE